MGPCRIISSYYAEGQHRIDLGIAPLMAVYKYINIYTVYIICHKS